MGDGNALKKCEDKKKEFDLTDPEILGFFIGAAAHEYYCLKKNKRGIQAEIKYFKIKMLPLDVAEIDAHIEGINIRVPPVRPEKMDDVYEGFDQKLVNDLKDVKFCQWHMREQGKWLWVLWSIYTWYTVKAPKELKRLVKRDHILHRDLDDDEDD